MNNNLKFELKLKQLDEAVKRLEKLKAKGWKDLIESTEYQIAKLERELSEIRG